MKKLSVVCPGERSRCWMPPQHLLGAARAAKTLGSWRAGDWQVDCEGRAFSRIAGNREPAAVPVHDVLDQRKAKPGAALRAAIGDVDAVEALGQSRQMLG